MLTESSAPSLSSSGRENCLEGRSVGAYFDFSIVTKVQELLCSPGYLTRIFRNIWLPDLLGPGGVCSCTCDSHWIVSCCPCYFCAFYYRWAFLLPAGKRYRDLDLMSVIKSRQRRRPGVWVVGEGCRRAQRVPAAKAQQRNICVCVSWSMCLSRRGRSSMPHQRSTVEDLLPRLTVDSHNHLSACSDPSVSC